MDLTRQSFKIGILHKIRKIAAGFCILALTPATMPAGAVIAPLTQTQAPADAAPAKLPAEQLDSLVAPIALYSDSLLTQTLVSSTYPLEIIQLQQWLEKNKSLKDKALSEAVQKHDWDPSVQAMAQFPDVVKRMAESIKWTADLGNAFLAQQNEVMDAVQRMRAKAQANGQLKSSSQQKVETQTVESKPVIIIEQANPQVVYVPSYDPVVVYGAPVYPYPPVYYPPPGYYAAGMAISFGVGIAMGAAWGGGWGWNTGWGGNNDITVNRNNTFVNRSDRTNNINRGNRASTLPAGGRDTWQHNPQHRGGAPYPNRDIANKYGGSARGDTLESRRDQAQNRGQRGQGAGVSDRRANAGQGSGADRRANAGQGAADRRGDAGQGRADRGAGDRTAGGDRGASDANRGGGDRVGNRQVPSSPSSNNRGAFGGSGTSGGDARASGSRGASSMSGRGSGGGGGRRGGGGGGRRR
jgi:hypothetical protein